MSLHRKQSGFTLVELIIAIAVLAILAGIAIPSYIEWLPKSRLNGAARQVMGDLMWARMQAVKENNEFRVFWGDQNGAVPYGTFYRILDDNNNDGDQDAGEGWVKSGHADGNISITNEYHDVTISFISEEDEANTVSNPIFFPKGTVDSRENFILTNSSGSKYVRVAITGRVRVECRPDWFPGDPDWIP